MRLVEDEIKLELGTEKDDQNDLDLLRVMLDRNTREFSYFVKQFKAEVQKNRIPALDVIVPRNGTSLYQHHHIIPNNAIWKCVDEFLNDRTILDKAKLLEEYLNRDPIKRIILTRDKHGKDLLERRSSHGNLIWTAIAHNPWNMFHGPSTYFRTDDPRGQPEEAYLALAHQRPEDQEYVEAYKRFQQEPTLAHFFDMPKTASIQAVRDLRVEKLKFHYA